MAADVKQLNEAEPIDTTRCEALADKVIAERRLDAELLAAASVDVAGARRWYALRVGDHCEIALCDDLIRARVDAVVPVKQVPVRRRFQGGRGKLIHKPVLRSLVFVSIVPSDAAFAGLLRVRDIAAIIGSGARPYPIGDREMNGFMDLAQKGAFDERNTPTGLKVGSRVRINVGPFADFDGVLVGYARGRTARVATWLFGNEMTVDVTLAHLEKLE